MKTLMATLLMAAVIIASGQQTNLTPEQIAARRAENQRRTQEMNEKLIKATEEALALQKAVAERRALNPPVSGFADPQHFVLQPHTNRPPLVDTNGRVPIQALEIMERMIPGSTTNVPPPSTLRPLHECGDVGDDRVSAHAPGFAGRYSDHGYQLPGKTEAVAF